jgi:hypothetical protein
MEMTQFEFVDYVVVCQTNDCSNKDISIEIKSFKNNPSIICGVCLLPITQVSTPSKK